MHKFISGHKVHKLWLGIKCWTAVDVLFCIYHFHRKTTYRLYLPKYQAFLYPPFSVQKSKSIDYCIIWSHVHFTLIHKFTFIDLAWRLGTNGLIKQYSFNERATTKLVKCTKNWNFSFVNFICFHHNVSGLIYFLYCDFLNFPLSESWLCTMSRGQTDCPWFIHQRLGVLLMAPISLIFHIIHLNSTCWHSPSRKIKSTNMTWGYKGPGHQKLWFWSFSPKEFLG